MYLRTLNMHNMHALNMPMQQCSNTPSRLCILITEGIEEIYSLC